MAIGEGLSPAALSGEQLRKLKDLEEGLNTAKTDGKEVFLLALNKGKGE